MWKIRYPKEGIAKLKARRLKRKHRGYGDTFFMLTIDLQESFIADDSMILHVAMHVLNLYWK